VPGVFTPENEAKRQAVNRWIRTGGAFDGVIDFDATVRDPANPARLRPAYDFDGVHLNDTGYEAMANAVNLQMLF
jgi:lysophospholipase L1-like esterase